jgi:hypothetical protein
MIEFNRFRNTDRHRLFCITVASTLPRSLIPTPAFAFAFDTIHSSCRIYSVKQASSNYASIPMPYIKSRWTANENRRKKRIATLQG